jgi:hypothetical protein
MRTLAALGGLGFFAAIGLAQQPAATDFATDKAARVACESPVVTVLPPPVVVPRYVSRICYTPKMLLKLPECELVNIYKCGVPTPVPCGYTPGLVIFKPGSLITAPTAYGLKATAWQGKYIPGDGTMVNRQFGVPSIKAAIEDGESYIDGGPTLVFDYEDTSLICTRYRDEVRQVSPGVYLGVMHKRTKDGPKIATWFALDARGNGCCAPGGK